MSQTDALIRFFFKTDPDEMSTEKYIRIASQLWWTLKVTGNIEEKDGKINFVK